MTDKRSGIAVKTAALVEDHSYLASLLALLCLLFAVNFFLTGPGSDGGSGLGGTGKFGGESGLGGTGNTPDSGPGFKLGAIDTRENENPGMLEIATPVSREALLAAMPQSSKPVLDIDSLRLAPELPALPKENTEQRNQLVNELVAGIVLETNEQALEQVFAEEITGITTDSLLASVDILNSLMLAEAQTRMQVAAVETSEEAAIRSRLSIPVRPERPDRLSVPTRIAPVQRVNVPAPPPVRPMRTLSTLLGK